MVGRRRWYSRRPISCRDSLATLESRGPSGQPVASCFPSWASLTRSVVRWCGARRVLPTPLNVKRARPKRRDNKKKKKYNVSTTAVTTRTTISSDVLGDKLRADRTPPSCRRRHHDTVLHVLVFWGPTRRSSLGGPTRRVLSLPGESQYEYARARTTYHVPQPKRRATTATPNLLFSILQLV